MKDDCTFFSNFLTIVLCNSSANCWFDIISLLIASLSARVTEQPEDFCQNFYKPLKQAHVDFRPILDFW